MPDQRAKSKRVLLVIVQTAPASQANRGLACEQDDTRQQCREQIDD